MTNHCESISVFRTFLICPVARAGRSFAGFFINGCVVTLDINQIAARCQSVEDALHRLQQALQRDDLHSIYYAFALRRRERARNDVITAYTGPEDLFQAFLQVGGPATAVHAERLEQTGQAEQISTAALLNTLSDRQDPRTSFIASCVNAGARTMWLCPFDGPATMGYGLLNLLFTTDGADPPVDPEDIDGFGAKVHLAIRDAGLLGQRFGLTGKETAVLDQLAQGYSAQDIAADQGITQRAIEKRVENARKKLNAANAVEAVYKATAYRILPVA